MVNAIENANENGHLLPFINGVLNTKTLELLPHSPNNYNTHIIPLNYCKEDSIENTKFKYFLNSITNNDPMKLKILRACLYFIFTNNLRKQKALYLYGVGGTGKSTFVEILIYLLTKKGAISTSLSRINSKFGVISILNKKLLILNDIPHYRGEEPSSIKNIITQDYIEAEEKFKLSFMFKPNCFMIITSNYL